MLRWGTLLTQEKGVVLLGRLEPVLLLSGTLLPSLAQQWGRPQLKRLGQVLLVVVACGLGQRLLLLHQQQGACRG
jgi:hypothetical protein